MRRTRFPLRTSSLKAPRGLRRFNWSSHRVPSLLPLSLMGQQHAAITDEGRAVSNARALWVVRSGPRAARIVCAWTFDSDEVRGRYQIDSDSTQGMDGTLCGREQDLTMGATLTYIGPSSRLFLPRTIFVVPTITFFLRGSGSSTGCIPR